MTRPDELPEFIHCGDEGDVKVCCRCLCIFTDKGCPTCAERDAR